MRVLFITRLNTFARVWARARAIACLSWKGLVLQMKIMYMRKKYGMYLKQKILESIMTYTSKVMRYCMQKYMKTLEMNALKYID